MYEWQIWENLKFYEVKFKSNPVNSVELVKGNPISKETEKKSISGLLRIGPLI